MDDEKLRDTVRKIKMPDEMRARVIRNCQSKALEETEGITMKEGEAKAKWQRETAAQDGSSKRRLNAAAQSNGTERRRKSAAQDGGSKRRLDAAAQSSGTKRQRKAAASVAAIAAVSLCLCLTAAVAGARGRLGFFKDVTDWTGAVVGTEYEQASDEIEVTVLADKSKNEITVRAVMAHPAILPYRDLETLGIESYEILDSSGKAVVEGERTGLFELSNGKSEITIPLDNVGSGEYKLAITAFVGAKKADLPLPIHGTWECAFSL